MKKRPLTPDEIDRLVAGAGPVRSELDEALRSLRAEFAQAPAPDVRTTHLRVMMAALGEPGGAPSPRRRTARRRKLVVLTALASVLVGGSALAATGALPSAAQDAVAKVAHDVGLEIPHTTKAPNPHSTPGRSFANAKKQWLDCEKSGSTTCGPKPEAQDFIVHPTTPASSDHPGVGHGNPHASHGPEHTLSPERTPHPSNGEGSGGEGVHETPKLTSTPHLSDGGHGDDVRSSDPARAPGD